MQCALACEHFFFLILLLSFILFLHVIVTCTVCLIKLSFSLSLPLSCLCGKRTAAPLICARPFPLRASFLPAYLFFLTTTTHSFVWKINARSLSFQNEESSFSATRLSRRGAAGDLLSIQQVWLSHGFGHVLKKRNDQL